MSNDGFDVKKTLVSWANIGLPLPMTLAVVGSLFVAFLWLDGQLTAIRKDATDMRVRISRNTVSPDHAWRRWDMRLWCFRVEKENKGFRCPDPYSQPVPKPAGALQ